MKKPSFGGPTTTVLYVILIAAWFLSWLVVGDGNWWLTLINRIVSYLFLPVPFVLAWSIFSGHFKVFIPLLLPILIFVNLYHPYLLPRFAGTDKNNSPLSVMTYNVLYQNTDYDAVARVILTYHPDLVALQEVQPEMMDALEERLAIIYPYSRMGTENDYGTTAVFSRYPFSNVDVLDLETDRPAVVVRTNIHDQEIVFAAVHLLAYGLHWVKLNDIPETVMKRTADQNRQVELLLEEIKNEDGIVILGCDCNGKETSSSYRMLDREMNNAARGSGWLLSESTFPNARPDIALQHIDYVWYRGSLKPAGVYRVNDSGGSDHVPVLAFFDLK